MLADANTARLTVRPLYGFLLLALLVLLITALMHGQVPLPIADVWRALVQPDDNISKIIVLEIRLPRALLAMLVGAALGVAGAALQGLFRNPLAEPGVIGVSSCASLGAVIAIYYGFSSAFWFVLPAFAIIGAVLGVAVLFSLAGRQHSITTLLLAGVALNALAGSCIALALNLAPNPYAMSEMVYWLLGSFANRSFTEFWLALPFVLLGLLLCWRERRFLDALSLGEDTAHSLGFVVSRHRFWLIAGIAMAVGAAVAVSGSIGFVGLLIPHLLRPIIGQQPSQLLPASALAGAVFLLLADRLVQYLTLQQELKIGVITALVGAPFFLLLVLRNRSPN